MHAVQLFGTPRKYWSPNSITLLQLLLEHILFCVAAMIKIRIKSHLIQDDLEHERLILLRRQQFSQEETLKQMELLPQGTQLHLSMPCMIKLGIR